MTTSKNVLEVKNLKTYFYTRRGVSKAVDGVNFAVREGETLGLVGESGCGKSVTCLSILQLVPQPAGKIVSGEIILEGEDLLKKNQREMRHIRGKRASMILQDPMTALNPVFSIGNQMFESLRLHGDRGRARLWERAIEMLGLFQIPSPSVRLRNYPHQLSGGRRQRVVGAIGLSCSPRLLMADEPTTSLDVTIQAQYLRLLKDLQQQNNLSLIVVTHDVGIAARMCDRVAVMYAGKIVEMGNVMDIFDRPLHPYTLMLMQSVPKLEEKVDRLASIEGQPPPPDQFPIGCRFAPRCTRKEEHGKWGEDPTLIEVEKDHWVSCWLYK